MPTQADWYVVQDLHPRLLLVTLPQGISLADQRLFAEIVVHIVHQSDATTQFYQIQMRHDALITQHLAGKKEMKTYRTPLKKSLFDELWAPGSTTEVNGPSRS